MPPLFIFYHDFMKDKTLGDDNGFQLAKDYLKTIDYYPGLEKYLEEYNQDRWNDAMNQLLSQPHKGDGTKNPDDKNIEKYSLKKKYFYFCISFESSAARFFTMLNLFCGRVSKSFINS